MAVPATELEKFIAALHAKPEPAEATDPKDATKKIITYPPRDGAYYDELAAMLPGILNEVGLGGKDQLNKEDSATLMRAITDKLDTAGGPDANPGVQGSFSKAFQRAMGKDGDFENLKLSELQEELRAKEFRDQIHVAQIGMMNRAAQTQQPVWTLEKIMRLIQALVSGDPAKLQSALAGAARPEKPLEFTPEAQKVNIDHPAMTDLADMSKDMVERVFWAANKPGEAFDGTKIAGEDYSAKGPISEAALEALNPDSPEYKFFKDQPRLEVVMDQVIADMEREGVLQAYMDKHGIAPNMMDELKASLRSGLLKGEEGGRMLAIPGSDKEYAVTMKTADVQQTASRLFGAKLDDPQFNLSPVDGPRVAEIMGAAYADDFKGMVKLPGDFAWRMAKEAGYDKDVEAGALKTYDNFYKPDGSLNLEGFSDEAKAFITDMHKTAKDNLDQVLGYIHPYTNLDREIPKGSLPEHLKEFEGKRAIALLEDLTGGAVAEKYRADPLLRARIGMGGEAMSPRDRFAQVKPPHEEMFDIRQTFNDLSIDSSGRITLPDGRSIQMSLPEGGITVYAARGEKGMTADGQHVVNYDVIDRFDFQNLKRAMGDEKFSLTFLVERDGKNAAGWYVQTKDGRGMYLGLGADGGIDETGLDDSIKAERKTDPKPEAYAGPGVVYETSLRDAPAGPHAMRIGMGG